MCEMGGHVSEAYHLMLSSSLNIVMAVIFNLLRPTEKFCAVSC